MPKAKHHPEASRLITEAFEGLPAWSRAICQKLREIVLKSDPGMIEDWKWGPNYYSNGMVCGISAWKKHVNLVFFNGCILADPDGHLQAPAGTQRNRHLQFKQVNEIDEEIVLGFLFQAIDQNANGIKPPPVDKTVILPPDLKKALTKHKVLKIFEGMTWSRRKEYVYWVESAKREETRTGRIEKTVLKMLKGDFKLYG